MDGGIDEVHRSRGLEPARNLLDVRGRQPALDVVLGHEPDADGHGAARGRPDALQHPEHEAQAIVERAAVLVGPVVVEGREEVVEQRIAVRGVQLHPVESALASQRRGDAKGLDDLVDLLDLQRLAGRVVRAVADCRSLGGAERRRLVVEKSGRDADVLPAPVLELQENAPAVPVDGLRHTPVRGQHPRVEARHVRLHRVRRASVDADRLGDEETGASSGALAQILGVRLAPESRSTRRQEVLDQPGSVRHLDDPVPDLDRADPAGREEARKSSQGCAPARRPSRVRQGRARGPGMATWRRPRALTCGRRGRRRSC